MIFGINVLITATISPNTDIAVTVSNAKERLENYIDALNFWIDETNVSEVIFCENSGYQWDYSDLTKRAEKNGKKIEFLSFSASEDGFTKGKGYLEGEIFNFAMENSSLIGNWKSFYKVSGRVKILNINKIFKSCANGDSYGMLAAPFSNTMDTRFFKMSKDLFLDNFSNLYKNVDDAKGIYLEHVFYEKAKELGSLCTFNVYPNVVGISGSTGVSYGKSQLGLILRQIAVWGGAYRLPRK